MVDFNILEDDDDDVEPIDYDIVSQYAAQGLKNPRMIAHAMNLPVDWFTDVYKEKIEVAIERGISLLAFASIKQIRGNASSGDFQAQKYILQNIDPEWSDKKEVINRNEIDILGLPSLRELFDKGLEKIAAEKQINSIEGECKEE